MQLLRCLILCCLLASAFSCKGNGVLLQNSQLVLVASTPGDSFIKSVLDIPAAMKVDFIRWKLVLQDGSNDSFSLHISFGESRPNTLGFMEDHKKFYSGTYAVTGSGKRFYEFSSSSFTQPLAALKLNENIYHLLGPQNRLINGNGGWSYTLNRESPLPTGGDIAGKPFPASVFSDTATQVTFDGRTPCAIARDYKYNFSVECFKLKWRMTLRSDGPGGQSGTYTINRTLSRAEKLTGKWVVRKHPLNPAVHILQLDPDLPEKSLAFLIADEDVLFFLKQDYTLYSGNKDFSYTMNRKTR